MMYRVYMEYFQTNPDTGIRDSERTRIIISGNSLNIILVDPTIDLALNKAGKAEFTVPASHPYYSEIIPMVNNIEICDAINGVETPIFFGRISNVNRGWNNQKRVTCEGALAFFNDTVQRYKKYPSAKTKLIDEGTSGNYISFIKTVLNRHNEQMEDESRKIYFGNMTLYDPEDETGQRLINDKKVYRLTNYETTLEVLVSMCLESEGGYMSVRREYVDGMPINYLDWTNKLDVNINQPAKFGLNLTDLNQDFDPDELYTALLPLGANYDKYTGVTAKSGDNPYEKGWYLSDEPGHFVQAQETTADLTKNYYEKSERPTTIKSVNDNVDYIQNDAAVAKYGFILKVKKWEDITNKSDLKKKAKQWMKTERFDKLVITCDVAELSILRTEFDPFILGKVVRIVSPPHGITEDDPIMLPISEIHYDLNTGKKEVTIGTQPQVTLSRITKKGNTKEIRVPDAKYDNDVVDDNS